MTDNNSKPNSVSKCCCVSRSALIWVACTAFMAPVSVAQTSADLDGDGVADVIDIDQDNDGIINSLEGVFFLTDLPGAKYFSALAESEPTRGSIREYDLVRTDTGSAAKLTGRVVASEIDVEWTMHGMQPKLRNLGAGTTTVQWNVMDNDEAIGDLDLTISDLDGLRAETITVSAQALVGYSLSLNTNIRVNLASGQYNFTGTGAGGDSKDDQVTLHFRNGNAESLAIVVSYKNGFNPAHNVGSVSSDSNGTIGSGEADIAGYRHALERSSSGYYTAVAQYRDSDGDSVPDHRDLDSDNDGIGDVIEAGGVDADNNNLIDGTVNYQGLSGLADPGLTADAVASAYLADSTANNAVSGDDADGDGLLSSVDSLPDVFGGSLAGSDSDSDGLSDLDEILTYQTDPDDPDSDQDGLTDQSEVALYNTDPLQPDTDRDGLSDGDEVKVHSTSPTSVDTDADGIIDGEEVEDGTDPLQRLSVVMNDPALPSGRLDKTVVPVVGPDAGARPIVLPPDELPNPAAAMDAGMKGGDGDAAGMSPAMFNDPQSDDPRSNELVPLRTGLSGAPGCSVAMSATDPFMFILLLLAVGYLVRPNRSIRSVPNFRV